MGQRKTPLASLSGSGVRSVVLLNHELERGAGLTKSGPRLVVLYHHPWSAVSIGPVLEASQMFTHANASLSISACALPSSLFTLLAGSSLLPMVPLTAMLPIAGYVWSDPGSHFWAYFIGYVSLVMAGLLAIHARSRSRAEVVPHGVDRPDRSEWADCIHRLEQVIVTLSEVPNVAGAYPRTLH